MLRTLAIFSSVFLSYVQGHGYLFNPKSRTMTFIRDPTGTMGCPSSSPGAVTTYQPGETINVRYWRNNHIGGFIRWALVPRGKESGGDFDANVFAYTCRESGPECNAKSGSWSSEDATYPAPFTIACGDTLTLPNWLPEGDYVLQWKWFSAGGHMGANQEAEFTYINCADIHLSGSGSGSKPQCPSFKGGDRVSHNEGKGDDVCFYIGDNFVPNNRYIGSGNPRDNYKFGKPAQVEGCVETPPPPPPTPEPTPAPTPEPTPPMEPQVQADEHVTDDEDKQVADLIDPDEASDSDNEDKTSGKYVYANTEFDTEIMHPPTEEEIEEAKKKESEKTIQSLETTEITTKTDADNGGGATFTVLTVLAVAVVGVAAAVVVIVRKKKQEFDEMESKSPGPTPHQLENPHNMLVTPCGSTIL